MKRLIILLLPVLLVLSSCKKEYITPNKTIVLNLSSGSWIPLNGGMSYTVALSVPEIDNYMNERGGVLVYLSFGDNTYEQIPQVYNGDAYSFVTRPGQIVLEAQSYDGQGIIPRPVNMTVKIILIESDF
ncbi:MAG: hypothetical protein H7Y07_00210 [Pyrinomonadaceae bacterium]|nr:hypothetical protein [Sphingobacteriaceae bacterium]